MLFYQEQYRVERRQTLPSSKLHKATHEVNASSSGRNKPRNKVHVHFNNDVFVKDCKRSPFLSQILSPESGAASNFMPDIKTSKCHCFRKDVWPENGTLVSESRRLRFISLQDQRPIQGSTWRENREVSTTWRVEQ
ncbi:hypothetical protein NPIL_252901 [Nephila pilipes]|uniref:Uncharacterized protein n=1 Tax=Nephila pilipes TaxID=299642 RepID=A0A8X6QV25_NEPPI|nr:hypothetical protein NPIL_252901 [Nephila pilipes]